MPEETHTIISTPQFLREREREREIGQGEKKGDIKEETQEMEREKLDGSRSKDRQSSRQSEV